MSGRGGAFVPTDKHRLAVARMSSVGITNVMIARYLGITEDTLVKYFPEETTKGRTEKFESVANRLYEIALTAPPKEAITALIFIAKCQGGWKDTSRVEHTGAEGGPIAIGHHVDAPPQETYEQWVARQQKKLTEEKVIEVSMGSATRAAIGSDGGDVVQ